VPLHTPQSQHQHHPRRATRLDGALKAGHTQRGSTAIPATTKMLKKAVAPGTAPASRTPRPSRASLGLHRWPFAQTGESQLISPHAPNPQAGGMRISPARLIPRLKAAAIGAGPMQCVLCSFHSPPAAAVPACVQPSPRPCACSSSAGGWTAVEAAAPGPGDVQQQLPGVRWQGGVVVGAQWRRPADCC
jgi:hypothetical protein